MTICNSLKACFFLVLTIATFLGSFPAVSVDCAMAKEWAYHKTADNKHPSGFEQRQLWFINRARANPKAEGIWLATESHPHVSQERDLVYKVHTDTLKIEFAKITQKPPAAFDSRLYEAAVAHSEYLISVDGQNHDGWDERIKISGFMPQIPVLIGLFYLNTKSSLNVHAAFNIDWIWEFWPGADGMRDDRVHRTTLMSDGDAFTNVGIASVYVPNNQTLGPYVTTENFAEADATKVNHYNGFIVGTVWTDKNGNGWYDTDEGLAGVRVQPDIGTYHAITADSGGYAIPITDKGAVTIRFSGGDLLTSGSRTTTLAAASKLVDFIHVAPVTPPPPPPPPSDFPWHMFLPAIQAGGK